MQASTFRTLSATTSRWQLFRDRQRVSRQKFSAHTGLNVPHVSHLSMTCQWRDTRFRFNVIWRHPQEQQLHVRWMPLYMCAMAGYIQTSAMVLCKTQNTTANMPEIYMANTGWCCRLDAVSQLSLQTRDHDAYTYSCNLTHRLSRFRLHSRQPSGGWQGASPGQRRAPSS